MEPETAPRAADRSNPSQPTQVSEAAHTAAMLLKHVEEPFPNYHQVGNWIRFARDLGAGGKECVPALLVTLTKHFGDWTNHHHAAAWLALVSIDPDNHLQGAKQATRALLTHPDLNSRIAALELVRTIGRGDPEIFVSLTSAYRDWKASPTTLSRFHESWAHEALLKITESADQRFELIMQALTSKDAGILNRAVATLKHYPDLTPRFVTYLQQILSQWEQSEVKSPTSQGAYLVQQLRELLQNVPP